MSFLDEFTTKQTNFLSDFTVSNSPPNLAQTFENNFTQTSTPAIAPQGTLNLNPISIFNSVLPGVKPIIQSITSLSLDPYKKYLADTAVKNAPFTYDSLGNRTGLNTETLSNLAIGSIGGSGELAGAIENIAKSKSVTEIAPILESIGIQKSLVPEAAKLFSTVDDPKIVSSLLNSTFGLTKLANETSSLPTQVGKQPETLQVPKPIEPQIIPPPQEVFSLPETIKSIANSQVNVDTLNISKASKDLINKTVEEVKPQIEESVGHTLSNSEAIKLADNSSKILNKVADREQTLEWEAAMLRTRQKLASMAESGTVDKEFLDTLKTVKTLGTDLGRKLQSLSIGADPKDITSKQAIIEAVLKVTDNTDEILAKANGVDFTNLKQATDFYREFIKPKATEWLDLVRYNSMLSSPNTQINNTFSNAINSTLVATIEKTLNGGLDWMKSPVTGKREAFAGEGAVYLTNMFNDFSQATKRFGEVIKGTKAYTNLDIKNLPPATSGVKGAVVNTLSVPMKIMEATDQFFQTLATSGEKAALEYRKSKGVNVGNIESKAEEAAAYRLFRQDLNPKSQGYVLNAIDEMTGKLQSLRNSNNPVISNIAKFTVPFIKTPMNIFKQGLEYSPAGLATMPGAANKTEQFTKAIIGSAVFAGAATLLASNRLTWSEPTDPDQKNAYRDAGKQPYSVKIGDTWFSYQKLPPPIAFPLAMVAAMNDTLANKKTDQDTVDLVLSSIAKYGTFLADQSYAKSIGDLIGAVTGKIPSGWSQVISNYPQQLVPYRALGGWLARLTDNTQRQVDNKAGFIDKQVQLLMTNIPGLSDNVPARTNVKGEEIKQSNNVINAFSPVKTSKENPEKAQDYENILNLKEINKQEAKASADLKVKAIQLDSELSKLSSEEARAKYEEILKTDPKLASKIQDVATDRKLNLSYEEKLMNSLGVENGERAKYIDTQIMKLPTQEARRAYYEDLRNKKIISDNVAEQLAKMKKN